MSTEWDELAKSLQLPDAGGGPEASLRQSMFTASKTTPDLRAKALDVQKQTGIPADIADRNFEQITQRQQVDSLPYDRIIKETPKLAEWLSDPNNAAVAKDDLAHMGWLEWSLTKLADYGRAAASGAISGTGSALSGLGVLADVVNRNFQILAPENAAIRAIVTGRPMTLPPLPFSPDVAPPTPKAERGPWWSGPLNVLEAAGEQAKKGGKAILPPPERQGFGTEVMSGVGQLVPLVAASMIGGPGASITMFAGQGAGDMADHVAPELATQYNKDLAVLAGAGIAVGTGEIGLGLLLERVPFQVKNAIVSKIADTVAAAGIQAGQAFSQQLLNGVAQRLLINPDTPLLPNIGEQLASAGATGALARLLLSSVIGVNLPSHFDERAKTLQDVGKGIAESKVFERSPDAVRNFIESVTKDSPAENVGIPVDKFREYFQSRNIDPAQAAEAITAGGAEKFRQAALTGADLEVPFADYATKIMTGDHAEGLNKEVRFHPGEMNFNEMTAFVDEAKKQSEPVSATDESAAKVREDIVGQLTGLGYDSSAVDAYATMYEAFFKSTGERSGVDPKQFFDQYGLKVTRPLPDILKNIGTTDSLDNMLDRVRTGDIPDQSKLFGDSLVQFIKKNGGVQDEGGDLASREPDKGAKPFTKKLIQKDGLPLDTMRERAAEAGYLPQDSSISDFLDKIDEELRGQPVYTEAAVTEASSHPEFMAAQSLNELSQYLNDRSIDLKALSNDQVKKILTDAAAMERTGGGVEFNQSKKAGGGPELSVLHKLSSENLIFADQIGGLAVPSLAVVPGNMAMGEGYGDVTLIGRSNLGDPRETPIFDADIYSSTFPRPEYPKVKSKVAQKFTDKIRPFNKLFGDHILDTVWDNAVNTPNPADSVRFMLRSNAAKAMFLDSLGIDIEPVIRDVPLEFQWSGDEKLRTALEEFRKSDRAEEDLARLTEVAREAIKRFAASDPDFPKMVAIYQGDESQALARYASGYGDGGEWVVNDSMMMPESKAYKLERDVEKIGKRAVDSSASEERLNAALSGREAEFKSWVDEQILSMYDRPFLRNGRSKAPYTLESIVDYMTSPRIKAQEKTMTFGEGKARASAAKRFGSLDEMRRYAEMIGHPEQIDAAREEAKAAMESWRGEAIKYFGEPPSAGDRGAFGRTWEGLDASMRAIARWARGAKTAENLRRALAREDFRNIPEDVLDQGVEAGMLFLKAPVPYFEAKPQRAVMLSEFAGAVIPKNADQMVRDVLDRNKIPYREYDSYVQGSAQQATIDFRNELAAKGEKVLFQADNKDPNKLRRGAMRFGENRQFNIDLLRNADLSTFIHESGHFYLEVFGDIVDHLTGQGKTEALTDSQKQMQADYATLLKHFGVEGRGQIGETQHEEFARMVEGYMMEGKAPSVGLRGMFARFRSWLLNIYRSLSQLNVELTPEVRGVMDRLFASDKEIEAAQHEAELRPVFLTQRESGLDDPAWKAYQDTIQEAHDKSVAYLDQKLMRDLQRERAQWWKAERDKVREEVAAEVYQQPEYIAIEALKRGKNPDGTDAAVAMKLDLNMIKEKYGRTSAITEKLRRMGIARLEGGVHPDVAAEAFGFESGEALVNAIVNARPMKQLIDAEADDMMRTRHGDLLLDGSLPDQAKQAIFGKHRDDVVREEMRAIRSKQRETAPFVNAEAQQQAKERAYEVRWMEAEKRLAVALAEGRKQSEIDSLRAESAQIKKEQADSKREGMQAMNRGIPSDQQVARMATDMLNRTAIRDVRPDRYWAGARKSSRAAIAAVNKGDYYSALQLKSQELLNLELYRQANDAKDSFEATRTDWLKMFRADTKIAMTRNMDYVAAARAIAATYLFPQRMGDVIEAMRKLEAYDPDMHEVIVDQVNAATRGGKSFKDLTVEEFNGLRDIVSALWTMAKRDHQVLVDGKLVARQDAQDQMQAKILEQEGGYSKVGNNFAASNLDKAARGLLSLKAIGRRAESWVTAMDGGPDGPFRTYIWNPVKEAIDNYRVRKVQVFDEYQKIIGAIEKFLTNDKISAPELGYTFSGRAELLGALLHSGNREDRMSNLSKLLRGRESQGQPWGTIREDGTLDSTKWDAMIARMQRDGTLTKADYDYAQGVWDLFESLKPDLQKSHKEVYGHYFKEVPATAIDTPWGTYRGGYVPAKADPFMSPESAIRNEKQALSESGNSYAFPSAGTGNTKSRVGVAMPLAMNLSFIPAHIDWALRFAELQPRVKDVSKMLFDRTFRASLNDVDPEIAGGMLVPWLQRAATQRITTVGMNRVLDNFWSFVRANSGMQAVALSVNNGLQQMTGLFIANTKVPAPRLASALWEYVHSPVRMTNEIYERSNFMKTFENNRAVEIQRNINDMLLNPSVFAKAGDFARRHAGVMAQVTQGLVNTVAWMGAYDHAIASGLSEKEAVRRADSVIRETQGSFFPEDVSRMETGTPFMRALTMFSSYFNMQANLQTTEVGNTLRSDRGLTGKAGRVLSLYAIGFMMPAVVSQAIANSLSGNWGDDDDGYMKEALKLFFGSQFNVAAAMVPGVGQVGKAAYNAIFTDSSYDDDIKVSPWAGQIGSAIRDVAGWSHGKGDTKTTFKDVLSIIGVLSRLPLGPLGKPLGFLMDMSSGKARPQGPVDTARGLVTGRLPKK